MGGGGGGKPKKQPAPPQAQPLDVSAIMGAASAGAGGQMRAQYDSLIKNYPQLEALSLGTVRTIGGMLGGTPQPIFELREKKDNKGRVTGMERVQVGMTEPNQQTADALARIRQGLAMGDMDPDVTEPTSIEQALYDQGERELALGRSLSPEQVRESQQAARAAFAARGLGTSLGSSAAEVLNRDAMASARERERQAFASQQNTMLMGNIMGRRGALADLYFAGAGNLINADPTSRALGPGLGLASNTQGSQMQLSGQTYSSANQLAGMAALANAQMQEGRYNAYMNNQAAMRAAGMQSAAMGRAANIGLISNAIGSGIQAGGMIGLGQFGAARALSDKREKKDIKPLGKTGSILGLKAYSFKYKGEDKEHVGFMAQDVKKVLPEAVTEVEYKGKKRLAIKPAVIGAALAEELAQAKAA